LAGVTLPDESAIVNPAPAGSLVTATEPLELPVMVAQPASGTAVIKAAMMSICILTRSLLLCLSFE
jgi:hypothetical protein